ncbi:MAG: helix-turn-helix domain-containing protein [Firmicutes bacterium]|nr:helix-turn-helix domain-containing protein [Bacillota bacterium]
MSIFGENLYLYRTQEKLTQKQLADKLGLSANNIGHWEKGRTEPDIKTIIKLADIFDVTTDDLLGREAKKLD